MKESEIKQGVRVFISDNPTHTARTHTVIPSMTDMMGKEYTIERAVNSRHGTAADIKRFWWHPKDLTLIKPIIKKPEIHLFDVKELVT
jgi:3-oxoacyl-[acyl-carrier-protein] synthase III